eukprot:TRINITY_DN7652_c0_g1_i1.p1 TRINITY_DN7652_c0_g1~~TRINITY_DN7652_c0_g1_i1.p1  ORF type:complete len:94 (+),score=12.33 TRINITY_DN7652_c0_g1_i1:144-425(+)
MYQIDCTTLAFSFLNTCELFEVGCVSNRFYKLSKSKVLWNTLQWDPSYNSVWGLRDTPRSKASEPWQLLGSGDDLTRSRYVLANYICFKTTRR